MTFYFSASLLFDSV